MAKYGGTPPFFTQNFFSQNDSEWLEMDFKNNFLQRNILTHETPPPNVTFVTFFLGRHPLVEIMKFH